MLTSSLSQNRTYGPRIRLLFISLQIETELLVLRFLPLALPYKLRIFTKVLPPSSLKAMYGGGSCYSDERPKSAEYLSRCTTDSVPRPVGRLMFRLHEVTSF